LVAAVAAVQEGEHRHHHLQLELAVALESAAALEPAEEHLPQVAHPLLVVQPHLAEHLLLAAHPLLVAQPHPVEHPLLAAHPLLVAQPRPAEHLLLAAHPPLEAQPHLAEHLPLAAHPPLEAQPHLAEHLPLAAHPPLEAQPRLAEHQPAKVTKNPPAQKLAMLTRHIETGRMTPTQLAKAVWKDTLTDLHMPSIRVAQLGHWVMPVGKDSERSETETYQAEFPVAKILLHRNRMRPMLLAVEGYRLNPPMQTTALTMPVLCRL